MCVSQCDFLKSFLCIKKEYLHKNHEILIYNKNFQENFEKEYVKLNEKLNVNI
jgi:hypothetical protein